MALIPYVLLTTTDASGGDVTVTAYRQPRIQPPPATDYAPPATVSPRKWTPALDESSIAPLVERVVDGRTTKAIAPTADVTCKLMSYQSGGAQVWPIALGRIVLGQAVTVGYLGTDASGTVWTMTAPLVIASGTVGQWVDGRRIQGGLQVGGVEITVRSHPDLWDIQVPGRVLLGYQGGVLGNGTTTAGPISYTTVPADFSWQARVLVPLVWDHGANRHPIAYHPTVRWYAKLAADGYSWQFCCQYTTDAIGTLQELAGPTITPREAFHWVDFTFDTVAAGGGVEAIFGIDGTRTTVAHATALYATAGSWKLFSDGTYFSKTIMGAFAFFAVAQTGAQLDTYQAERLKNDATNLALFYAGPVVSSKLLDTAATNAAAPYDITVAGGTAVSLLEGDEGLAGYRPPYVFQGPNMPGTIVDAAASIYRYTSVESVEGIGPVNARGADWSIATEYDDLRSFLAAAAAGGPAAGTVRTCAFGGGVVQRGSPVVAGTDPEGLAADIRGAGGGGEFPWSLALGLDYSSSYVTFPAATFNPGGNDFAFDLFLSINHNPANPGAIVFNSSWLSIAAATRPNSDTPWLQIQVIGDSVTIILYAPLPTFTTFALRVEARETSGTTWEARALLNGVVVDSDLTGAGQLKATFPAVPTIADASASAMLHVGVLPMRLWGPGAVGTTDAEAEAEARKFLFRNPVNGTDPEYADLLGMWTGPDYTDTTKLQDLVGTVDGTLVNGTHWRPPLCWSDPVGAAVHTLRVLGSYAAASIDVDDSAYGLHGAQTLWAGPELTTVAELVGEAMGPGYALLRGNGTVVLGAPLAATAGNAQGTLTAGDVYEWGDRESKVESGYAGPPSRVETPWGRVGLEADPLPTAPEELAALISRPVGAVTADSPGWGLYGDANKQRVMLLPGQYRDRERALQAAEEAAVIYGTAERPTIRIVLRDLHYLTGYRAGDVVGLWDPRTETTVYYFIRQVTYHPQGDGPGDEWEVA